MMRMVDARRAYCEGRQWAIVSARLDEAPTVKLCGSEAVMITVMSGVADVLRAAHRALC